MLDIHDLMEQARRAQENQLSGEIVDTLVQLRHTCDEHGLNFRDLLDASDIPYLADRPAA